MVENRYKAYFPLGFLHKILLHFLSKFHHESNIRFRLPHKWFKCYSFSVLLLLVDLHIQEKGLNLKFGDDCRFLYQHSQVMLIYSGPVTSKGIMLLSIYSGGLEYGSAITISGSTNDKKHLVSIIFESCATSVSSEGWPTCSSLVIFLVSSSFLDCWGVWNSRLFSSGTWEERQATGQTGYIIICCCIIYSVCMCVDYFGKFITSEGLERRLHTIFSYLRAKLVFEWFTLLFGLMNCNWILPLELHPPFCFLLMSSALIIESSCISYLQ